MNEEREKYFIICRDTDYIDAFENQVNEAIKDGYRPTGGIVIRACGPRQIMCQAMYIDDIVAGMRNPPILRVE